MPAAFQELASHETPMGVISLRRRFDPSRQADVHEVKLGDEFLMSSAFTAAEEELARLGLAAAPGRELVVVVGGLGLGYTACTALEDPRLRSLVVVEALPEVIDWHERELLPDVAGLASDPRTTLRHGDFFALVEDGTGFHPDTPAGQVDVVLLDIDHTPRHVLHPSHASFYTRDGIRGLARELRPDGVFALWSDDPPDDDFLEVLEDVLTDVEAHVVTFPNPHTGGASANTVYVARSAGGSATPVSSGT